MVVQVEKCCHYWIIESPAGEYSQGTCCICNEVKMFTNSYDRLEKSDTQTAPESATEAGLENTMPTIEEDVPDTGSDEAQWPVVHAYLRKRLLETASTT